MQEIQFAEYENELLLCVDFGDHIFLDQDNLSISPSYSQITVYQLESYINLFADLLGGKGSYVEAGQGYIFGDNLRVREDNTQLSVEELNSQLQITGVFLALFSIFIGDNILETVNQEQISLTSLESNIDNFSDQIRGDVQFTADNFYIDVTRFTDVDVNTLASFLQFFTDEAIGEFRVETLGNSQKINVAIENVNVTEFLHSLPIEEATALVNYVLSNNNANALIDDQYEQLTVQDLVTQLTADTIVDPEEQESQNNALTSGDIQQLTTGSLSSTEVVNTSPDFDISYTEGAGTQIFTATEMNSYLDTEYNFPEIQGDVSYALEAYVKLLASPSGYTGILGHASNDGFGLQLNGLTPNFGYRSNNNLDATTQLNLNQWYHIAGVRVQGDDSYIFVDGIQENNIGNSTDLNVNLTSASVTIGGAGVRTNPFPGYIAEARIWSKSLLGGEINNGLARHFGGSEQGLIGYYPMYDVETNPEVILNESTNLADGVGDAILVDNPIHHIFPKAVLNQTLPDISLDGTTSIDLSNYIEAEELSVQTSNNNLDAVIESGTLYITGFEIGTTDITITGNSPNAPIPNGTSVQDTFTVTVNTVAEYEISGGDDVYYDSGYQYHEFQADTTEDLSITGDPAIIEALIVGAGGGTPTSNLGGVAKGGGGGGGIINQNIVINSQNYNVTIGQGVSNGNGEDTTAFGLTAIGGGKSGDNTGDLNGRDGGSGGGGTNDVNGGTGQGGRGLQGNDGASGAGDSVLAYRGGGGGGFTSAGSGRDGGDGLEWPSGSGVYYSGGGASTSDEGSGTTGLGGGTSNYGGGADYNQSIGGEGIVIVRYKPTVDNISPIVNDKTINTSYDSQNEEATVSFTEATDETSAQTALTYYLYSSTTDNLTTDAQTVENNGTLVDQSVDVSQFIVQSVTSDVWYNIVVEDEAGNKAIYTQELLDTSTQQVEENNISSMSFDGSDDTINLGDNYDLGLSDWTYNMIVKADNTSGWNTILGKTEFSSLNERFSISLRDDNFSVQFYGSGSLDDITSGQTVPTGEWLLLSVVLKRDSNLEMYLNGELYHTFDISSYSNTDFNIPNNFYIGSYDGYNGNSNGFEGLIDEVQIWNKALTRSEIVEYGNKILNGDEQGLVGYWNFEDRDPTQVTDLSVNENHGTINGNPTYEYDAFDFDYAMEFDGSNDYVQASVPNLPVGNEDRTVECVLKTNQSSTFPLVWWGSLSNNSQIYFGQNNSNEITLGWYGGSLTANKPLDQSSYLHLAFTVNSDIITIYLNGIQEAQTTHTLNTSFSDLYFGKRPDNYAFYSGLLNYVRVWNTVRTQREIQLNMNKELTGDESGLVGLWKFDDLTDLTTAVDSSPNGNNGVING